MPPRPTAILKGTLDMLILGTLELRPLHGIAIADRIRQVTDGTFGVGPGSLFPALYRLEQEGWVRAEWSMNDEGRRVRVYELTASGRKQLVTERKHWARIVNAVGQVLGEG
jgi:transcriptional regulator